jgi:hypothetical protein
VVKAVFFAYANLHEILAESGFNIKQRWESGILEKVLQII